MQMKTRSLSKILGLVLALLFGLASRSAIALNPTLRLAQYDHRTYGDRDGMSSRGYGFAQTAEGFLWIATNTGLVRFDGVTFERRTPVGVALGDVPVIGVTTTPDGSLWVGASGKGLGRVQNGDYQRVGSTSDAFTRLASVDETVWTVVNGKIYQLDGGNLVPIAREWGLESNSVVGFFKDKAQTLWVTDSTGLVHYLRRGQRKFLAIEGSQALEYFTQAKDGSVWACGDKGLVRMRFEVFDHVQVDSISKESCGAILVDRDNGLWMNTRNGLKHHGNLEALVAEKDVSGFDLLSPAQGLSSSLIGVLFEDSEGTVWAATSGGLDRFRETAMTRVPLPGQRFPTALALGADGAIIASKFDLPLMEVKDSKLKEFTEESGVRGMYRDAERTLWFGSRRGLWRKMGASEPVLVETPEAVRKSRIRAITGQRSGEIWVVTFDAGGVYRYADGAWKLGDEQAGFPPGWSITTAFTDLKGRVWFGSSDGILLLDGSQVRQFPRKSGGLDVGLVLTFANGPGGQVWAGGTDGLALFDGTLFKSVTDAAGASVGQTTGVVQLKNGDLWVHRGNDVLMFKAGNWSEGRLPPWSHRFDQRDGLYGSSSAFDPQPTAVEADDGRIWFSTNSGLASIDPANIRRREGWPTVLMTDMTVDGVRQKLSSPPQLPPLSRRVELAFTATALGAPEKIKFRYRLEDVDSVWQEGGSGRVAYYTDLRPGNHHFTVISTNEEGVWNQIGASLDFRVAPAWYQTAVFKLLVALTTLGLVWLAYRFRLGQVLSRAQRQMRAEQGERERIARELHDTLLQSIYGLMWRFQSVANQMSPTDATRDTMNAALEDAEEVLEEGRDRVAGLRLTEDSALGLAELLRKIGNDHSVRFGARFSIEVLGNERPLRPVIKNAVRRILGEALLNAFRHAEATEIVLKLNFQPKQFQARVEDDGKGIPSAVVKNGLPDHWGLRGMTERAAEIGATFEIVPGTESGTVVEVKIKARIAYDRGLMKY
jgi:signal transduction histidine kinase/ligand-binding sensor domain-containing protein